MSISSTRSSTSAIAPEFALLGLLSIQPAHGYELARRLKESLGSVWHINLNQLYNLLKRLEQQGYLIGETETQEKLPARRCFRLSPSGQQRFETWLQTPTGCSVRAIRLEFTTRLYFAMQRDAEFANRLIDEQAAAVLSGINQLTKALGHIPTEQSFNRLGIELRIRQLSSILDWLEHCREALNLKRNS
ncbi:MAG: PadR family transcriptional regulator [Chloroflexota bacterium]